MIPEEVEEAAEHYARSGEFPAVVDNAALRWINADIEAFLARVHQHQEVA